MEVKGQFNANRFYETAGGHSFQKIRSKGHSYRSEGEKMNRKQRRKRRESRENRGWILTAMAIMAAILGIVRSRVTEMPGMGTRMVPVQICMIVIGGGWLTMFLAANGAFDEMKEYYDDEDEEDEPWRSRNFSERNGSRRFPGCTDSGRDRTGNGKKKIMRKRKSALCMGSP